MDQVYAPYSPKVMDHFLHPRNLGELPDATAVGEARAGEHGDLVRVSLKIEGHRIVEVRARVFGCAVAIASASIGTELLKGRTMAEARKLSNRDVVEALGGLPEEKVRCSLLIEQATRAALESFSGGPSSE
jgi:nitrogen fixation NifU-like protein